MRRKVLMSFISGYGSVIDLCGQSFDLHLHDAPRSKPARRRGPTDDARFLRSDWERVGKDIYTAMMDVDEAMHVR